MDKVTLDGTDLRVSKFIFGTASLFNVGRSRDRQRLLLAAADAGFSHFDAAPFYGFGSAESDLGTVLQMRPDLTVTSKVGIYAPGGEDQSDAGVFARKAFGLVIPKLSSAMVNWQVDRARKSLDDSLRRLKRDVIDLYLIHEPSSLELITDEWAVWLDAEKKRGRIKNYGLAVSATALEIVLGAAQWPVLQVYDRLEMKEAHPVQTASRKFQITYGYVSSALKLNPQVNVADVLRAAAKRNASGAVVVSTKKIDRLKTFSTLCEHGR